MNKYIFSFLIILLNVNLLFADDIKISINSNWQFSKTKSEWKDIQIPHTWNDVDVLDDEPGYYRGKGYYKKNIYIPAEWGDKEIYLYFEGSGQETEVFVNGKRIGEHSGSYTAFSFRINDALKFSQNGNALNTIEVTVDNSYNENIPPLSADFTMFGGIYRDVYIKVLPKIHFDADNFASSGIFVSTPAVTNEKADILIKGKIRNRGDKNQNVEVTHSILDAYGNLFRQLHKRYSIKANSSIDFNDQIAGVKDFQLWSTENPYLYRVVSTIKDAKSKKIINQSVNPLGFRWFSFDAEKGFFLNGKHLKLIGASRHQDYFQKGNSLPNKIHVRDVELLKEMGGNVLRIAHYPQDPEILMACDRLGILATIEAPIVNTITESEAFTNNCLTMQTEMIRQNYNHPSLIAWAYMNEVLLRPRFEKGSERQEKYFHNITQLALKLDKLTKEEDPYRYTMISNHGNFDLYKRLQLTAIPDLVGWNLYQGWYSGSFEGFGRFIDNHRRQLPDKPLLITEYGADEDNRLHNFTPERFDKTVEYAQMYHKSYLAEIMKRDFVSAGMIWNLAEFSSEERGETTPHINAKGIMTIDRKPKNIYYFYQANLLKTPFLKFGDKFWSTLTGFADEQTLTCTQPVIVYSNQNSITLFHNGVKLKTKPVENGIAHFDVPFKNGINQLSVQAEIDNKLLQDVMEINFHMLSQNLKSKSLPFKELSVSLGDKRMFFDEEAGRNWVPEQEYVEGSWGYLGGEVFKRKNSTRQSYGSDKSISGTDLDAIFATQRMDIENFLFDVPAGDYILSLHFAELNSSIRTASLAYNLDSNLGVDDALESRIFNVVVNGKPVLRNLSNTDELVPEKSFSYDVEVGVNDDKGIKIDFEKITGSTILNGIQLKKIR